MPGIVATMRNEIIELGGEVRFGTRLVDWEFQEGAISSVSLEQVEKGTIYAQPVSKVVLACGHSARDVFDLCKRSDFAMEQKPFSVGVRIEHPQKVINSAQWGKAANHPALGAAEYNLRFICRMAEAFTLFACVQVAKWLRLPVKKAA